MVLVVPIRRPLARRLYPDRKHDLSDGLNYFYVRQDNDHYGIISSYGAKGKNDRHPHYCAVEGECNTNKKWWIQCPFDLGVIQCIGYVTSWTQAIIWRDGRWSKPCSFSWQEEVAVSRCDWIQPVISALVSGSENEYHSLPRYFGRSDLVMSKVFGWPLLRKGDHGELIAVGLYNILLGHAQ